ALRKVPGSVRQPLVGLAARVSKAKPPAERVLTKSVMCAFSLDWIVQRYQPPVVWVRRNPLNVVASLVELGTTLEHMERLYRRYRDPVLVEALVEPMSLPELPDGIDLVEQCAYWVGLNTAGYESSARLHGSFATVDHDALCADPSVGFQRLSARLGLEWNEAAEDFLRTSNRQGEGFETNRITALEPDRWRRSLADREDDLRRILSQFPGTQVS
ncbi:MAG TPA: hypothetical protein VGP46_06040, partial [Acidimicrobiales bacterium]|nr:hypothetical protein [Acidimicrobiales bacterium]